MLTVGCLGRHLDILCVFKNICNNIQMDQMSLAGPLSIANIPYVFLRGEKKKKVKEKGEVFPGSPIKSFVQSTITDSPGTPERCCKRKLIVIVHSTDFTQIRRAA